MRSRGWKEPVASSIARIQMKRKRIPLTRPNSISQLLKVVRKGHIMLTEVNRLSVARHRRGARGHEREGLAR